MSSPTDDDRRGLLPTGNPVRCPNCKKQYVPDLGLRRKPHLLIQDEFPRATPIQREQLQTGICSDKCWSEYLGVEEEAEDPGDGTEPETI